MATMSLRGAATATDPTVWNPNDFTASPKPKVTEAISMRALAEGHLYVNPAPVDCPDSGFRFPSASGSLRNVLSRHSQPSARQLRFLFLNTFLLQGPAIPWSNFFGPVFGGDVGAILGALGLSAAQILASDKLPGVLKTALKGASAIASGPLSILITALDIVGIDIIDLLRDLGLFPLPDRIRSAPALEARAAEIGAAIRDDYDVVAMCEVWTEDLRNILIDAAGPSFSVNPPEFDTPSGLLTILGSGLLCLGGSKFPIATSKPVTFNERGERLMDADAWANKGFLKTAVNLGIGTLEIYTLHTLSGNDFKDHSDDDLTNRKFNQIQQLLDSIQPQHNQSPKNVRLICGDLNLGAFVDGGNARSRAGKYQRLIDAMSAAGFIDAWNIWNGPSVERGTFDDADVTKRTNTCSFEDGQQLCQVFGSAAFQGKAKNSNANGQCYDYIFIERPVPSHAFHLDVTRVRRRPLKRVNPTEGIAYSSDHMGLDVGLVASPT